MLDDPTVAQWSSITATFACRNDWWYSWISMPAARSCPYSARDRVVQQQVLDAPLQEQRHRDAALRRGDQRAAEADARERSTSGDQDLALRRADRGEVRVLDVAAMAQVVADDEFRRLRAHPLRAAAARETAAPRSAGTATSSLIAQTRCIVRTIGDEQRALDAHARNRRAAASAPACSRRR